MSCKELHELAAAYALGALDEADRAAVEAHLARSGPHDGCHEEVERARRVVAGLAVTVDGVEVPAPLWSRVASGLSDAQGAAPADVDGANAPPPPALPRLGRTVPPTTPREARIREGVAWTLAAAAAVALWFQHAKEERTALEQADALANVAGERATAQKAVTDCQLTLDGLRKERAAAPDVASFLMPGAPKALALGALPGKSVEPRAFVSADKKQVLVMVETPPPEGREYQLWLIRGKEAPVPAPLLRATSQGRIFGLASLDTPRATPFDALGLSIEPRGGSVTPTEVVAVAKLGT